jgi:hypothetical protein
VNIHEAVGHIQSRKAFLNVVPRDIRLVQGILTKYNLSKIALIRLDRTKPKESRSKAKSFANQMDRALSGFQDSDVVLVALTVRHKA